MHGRFVSAQHFSHPRFDFVEIGFLGAGFMLQECGGHFDVARMRDADYNGAGDRRVLHKALFNLEGVDVFTACEELVSRQKSI